MQPLQVPYTPADRIYKYFIEWFTNYLRILCNTCVYRWNDFSCFLLSKTTSEFRSQNLRIPLGGGGGAEFWSSGEL